MLFAAVWATGARDQKHFDAMLGFILRLGCNTRAARCTGLEAQHAALDLLLRSPIEFVLVTAYAPLVSMRALESKTLNDDTNMLLCPFKATVRLFHLTFMLRVSEAGFLGDAPWLRTRPTANSQGIHSLSRWTILSAIENITCGLVWLIPFFTELRFALLARNPEMANALCGGLTLAFRCTCSSSRVGKRPVDLVEVWPRLARFTRACGKPDRSTP